MCSSTFMRSNVIFSDVSDLKASKSQEKAHAEMIDDYEATLAAIRRATSRPPPPPMAEKEKLTKEELREMYMGDFGMPTRKSIQGLQVQVTT